MDFYRVTKDSPAWQQKAYDYVRTDAFCFGQNIPVETEFNGDGPLDDLNAVIIVENHKPIAGCRIAYPRPDVAKIERVCVIRQQQKSGIGSLLIAEAERWIAEKGFSHIVISSQDRAAGFYEKVGYILNPNVSPNVYDTHPHRREKNDGPKIHFEPSFTCVLVEKYLDNISQ